MSPSKAHEPATRSGTLEQRVTDLEGERTRLQAEATRLARLLDQTTRSAEVGGWEIDVATGKLYWTPETHRLHDTTPETYTPAVDTAIAFYAPESVPLINTAVQLGLTQGVPFDLDLELVTARDRRIRVRAVGVAEREAGRTVRLYGSFQDITRRHEAAEALRRSEEKYRRLISSSPDCLLELDLDGRVLFVNPAGLALLELDPAGGVRGQPWLDLWPLTSHLDLTAAFRDARDNKDARLQVSGATGKGLPRWWDVHLVALRDSGGRPERILVSARDITPLRLAELEREEFQRNLLQTQKLESLGILAGGIAHDFNNLLTVVIGNANLVQAVTAPDAPAQDFADQIERAAERAADLCKQLLAYAGKGRFVVEPLDLSALVQDSAQLLHLSVSKKATLTCCLASGLPPILGDATQLRQVLMNLVINASEALGDQDGLIAVTTGQGHLTEGDYVFLEVADTGGGMDEDTRARIFEPFFTTKFTGRGLGLSAVLGIVNGHQGVLKLHSSPGKGSTFRLQFPPAAGPLTEPPPAEEAGDWAGTGMVLLVEDEEQVRRLTAELLTSFGYEVLLAGNGQDAVRLLEIEQARIRLVLLDLTMPRLDGAETLALIRARVPGLRVVLMSGYSEREVSERFAGKGLAGFLQKPFTREQLGRALRAALDE